MSSLGLGRAGREPSSRVSRAAELELNEAADFYDLRDPGLGSAFLDEVERSLREIVQHPEAAAEVRGAVRKRITASFPYSIFYSSHGDQVRIRAIAHQKRRPFYWRGRK
jgi:plasmid stabilization system protein ParE